MRRRLRQNRFRCKETRFEKVMTQVDECEIYTFTSRSATIEISRPLIEHHGEHKDTRPTTPIVLVMQLAQGHINEHYKLTF